jgi:hypothetical protein
VPAECLIVVSGGLSGASQALVLARLRTLRKNLDSARTALLNYKEDRIDRDRLEPAARRADQLMNLFTIDDKDPVQGAAWVAQILQEIETVTNPKAATALLEARGDIAALLEVMGRESARAKGEAG